MKKIPRKTNTGMEWPSSEGYGGIMSRRRIYANQADKQFGETVQF